MPRTDRHGVAVVTIAKDESRHIGEWVCFHRQAGIRRFVIYDNGSTDETVAVARSAAAPEQVTVVPWRQSLKDARLGRSLHNQVLAYAHAASNFGADFRWMAFIDVDEFLVPVRANSIPAALAHLEPCRNVSLPWRMFGTSGHKTPPDGGILRNYLRCSPVSAHDQPALRNFKCIVDPCHLTAVRVHSMETDGSDQTQNDRGEAVARCNRHRRCFYSADHLQLNHYYTRSEAEVAEKVQRGHMNGDDQRYLRKVRQVMECLDRETVEDRTVLEFLDRAGITELAPGEGVLG
ncbi:MAG: glycosyltransferase family 92 protein [Patescibacteria group bacterium]|nr:glycosyltransferase family 92 protein [Patescibacteria group bacterium]